MHVFFSLILIFSLSGCATMHLNRDFQRTSYPNLFNALDKEKDGFSASTTSGETFSIVSTFVGENKLCRLVKLTSSEDFYAETFCKTKGGEWK